MPNITVGFSGAINSGYQLTVSSPSGSIAGTSTLNQAGNEITFDPTGALPPDADITVNLSGVTSVEGATLAPRSWTFRTRSQESATSQTLFGDQVPQQLAVSDASPVEVGTAFSPSRDGRVTGIRFYKGTGNNGTHVGSLWSAEGTRLASVTFVGETSSGWQEATLSQPVSVSAGTTYVVSYLAPQGHYSATSGFFSTAWTSGDLTAPSTNNGRYLYGAAGGFPSFTWGATNYFVDVVFERAAATISVTDRDPVANATGVETSTRPAITFSAEVAATGWSMSVSAGGSAVPGSAGLSRAGRTRRFPPPTPQPPGAPGAGQVSGVVSTDGATLPTQTWSFTTAAATVQSYSLFDTLTPQTAASNDTGAVELGTAFTSSVAGSVTAIRFYKGTGNTGTHTGSLWNSAGTRLATVTFTGETATGWQTATLPTPVSITPGATYVVSYYAPNGRYAATPAALATSRTVGPLTAPGGANGRYRYGTGGGFPDRSWNSTNYFVDVRFRPAS